MIENLAIGGEKMAKEHQDIVERPGKTIRDGERRGGIPRCIDQVSSPERLLMSARHAAKALGISERTLWALTKSREIRHVPIGRRVLYDRRDLCAFIDRRKVGA